MRSLKKTLVKKDSSCKPIWFMRQAGRYLPEFRKIRSKNKDFIKLCLDSDLSSEITLQPIKRFDLDAAIIFSDILMVPYALGQGVKFIKNKGPKLTKFDLKDFNKNDKNIFFKKLNPVYKAISKTRKNLDNKKSLICFVGAPRTLLIYMLDLKKNKDEINFPQIAKKEIEVNLILDRLSDYLIIHIENQINAGADIVQVFDSWAGLLPPLDLSRLCYNQNLKIVNFCKSKKTPVICFPKGIKDNYFEFNKIVKPDALNIDYEIDPRWAQKKLTNVVLQGGMHPNILLKSDEEMYNETNLYLDIFKNVPYIFNLGHGLVPKTDPDKLARLINYVRKYK